MTIDDSTDVPSAKYLIGRLRDRIAVELRSADAYAAGFRSCIREHPRSTGGDYFVIFERNANGGTYNHRTVTHSQALFWLKRHVELAESYSIGSASDVFPSSYSVRNAPEIES